MPSIKSDNDTVATIELDSLPATVHRSELPPILSGHETPQLKRQVESFYGSVATMFEAWLRRRPSANTKRAYRQDVMNFVQFMDISWPEPNDAGNLVGPDESWKLLQATVPDVQAWRDYLDNECSAAPLTLNRRISSVSGFYKFMREVAAEASPFAIHRARNASSGNANRSVVSHPSKAACSHAGR